MKKITTKPNFFIIGAPKCGTTSLSVYLDEHENIAMSDPKEPYFFNTDMKYQGIRNLKNYMKCFSKANQTHIAVGEASTSYLYSKVALRHILEFNHDAKFIIMIRNPIDLVYSLHSELLFNGNEDESSFEKAWFLQKKRLNGQNIPRLCYEPFWLQYKRVGMLGERIERVFATVGRERVHVIIMDDMQKDMSAVYEAVLEFLQVPSDGRRVFPIINKNKIVRSKIFRYLLKSMIEFKNKIGLPPLHVGFFKRMTELNSKKHPREPLSPEFKKKLGQEFRADIEKLSELLNRDLSSWLYYENR